MDVLEELKIKVGNKSIIRAKYVKFKLKTNGSL